MSYLRHFKRRIYNVSYGKVGILLVILFVLYIEIFSYYVNKKRWNYLSCSDPKKCLKILLVADPQIIGHEKYYLTPLASYDSDRFLKVSYNHAYNFVKPDVTIFLGDLMDEGSTAMDSEYNKYVERFFNIFPNNLPNTQQIWLPGDNDIGGEGRDFVTPQKINRFNKVFPQGDFLSVYNITFFKINRMIQSIPKFEEKRNFYDISRIFVGLSHVPLIFIPSLFVDKVLKKMQPHLLFTAHEHKSMIVTTDGLLMQDRQIFPVTSEDNKVMEFTLGESDMYEILVPTCSYRMGTDKIGFGYAIIENNKLSYTVLWSQARFDLLSKYYYLLFFLFILIVFKCLKIMK